MLLSDDAKFDKINQSEILFSLEMEGPDQETVKVQGLLRYWPS